MPAREIHIVGFFVVSLLMGCGAKPTAPVPATESRSTANTMEGAQARQSSSASSARASTTNSGIGFRDITAESGVTFVYHNDTEAGHAAILESLGGGVALLDYDNDNWLDLLFAGGGTYEASSPPQPIPRGLPPGLFRNYNGKTFSVVTELAGAAVAPHYSHGLAPADFDHDGFTDVVITGYGGLVLLHNRGDGTFQSVSARAHLDDPLWSSSAGWGDINGDGDLDLYVAHYVNWSAQNHPYCPAPKRKQRDICTPRIFDSLPDRLFLNRGDGTFGDVSQNVGLRTDGKGLGVLLADLDHNGTLDIYVANDTTDNFFYLNQGGGKFTEVGALHGVATDDAGVPNGSMGLDVCDYNLDGLPDLWVANYERESFALYRNEGQAQFLHVSQATGITAVGTLFVGFGTLAVDVDRDGAEDLVVANGHVINFPTSAPLEQVPLLLHNRRGRFARVEFPMDSYFQRPQTGRGLAMGDLNQDGRMDLVFSNNNRPAAVLLGAGSDNNQWLEVELVGTRSPREAFGARMVLHTSAGDQLRHLRGGGSYLGHGRARAYWGIAAGVRVTGLTIHWPSGTVQRLDTLSPQQTLSVREPLSVSQNNHDNNPNAK